MRKIPGDDVPLAVFIPILLRLEPIMAERTRPELSTEHSPFLAPIAKLNEPNCRANVVFLL